MSQNADCQHLFSYFQPIGIFKKERERKKKTGSWGGGEGESAWYNLFHDQLASVIFAQAFQIPDYYSPVLLDIGQVSKSSHVLLAS